MLRSILVPLDGSTLAEQAIPLAAAIAEQHQASLGLAVVHPWGPAEDAPRPGTRRDRALREEEGIYLNQLMQSVAAAYRIPVYEALLDGAATGLTLLKYASQREFDLVVASTHDHGRLGRFLRRGIARRLAHAQRVSSLFIKPQVEPLPIRLAGFNQVLVALDGSPEAEAAVEPAAALSSREGEIILAAVTSGPSQSEAELRADTEDYLEEVARRARRFGRRIRPVVLTGRNVAAALVAYAEQEGIELIALTTRFRRTFARTIFGSVADAVLHRADVPVLVCHASPVTLVRKREAPNHAAAYLAEHSHRGP
jgi:nucleotide-binding universal stress UspA family protein